MSQTGQAQLEERIGSAALEGLLARGAAAHADDVLARAVGWLRSA